MNHQLREAALERAAGVRALIQGEVLPVVDACVVVADAAAPLSHEAAQVVAELGQDRGPIVVPQVVDEVVLLTQTCDLQFTTEQEFRCLVAPVVRSSENIAYQALRGRLPGFVGLPWLDGRSMADLSRITPIERSLLIDKLSLGRPRDPKERLHFAETVSRYMIRPALSDAINEVLKPFLIRIRDRHDRNSAEGRCMYKVWDLRLEAAPDLDAPEPALTVLMVIEEEDLPSLPDGVSVNDANVDALVRQGPAAAAAAVEAAGDPVARREAWFALAECWIQPAVAAATTADGVDTVEVVVLNGEELTYARSRNAPPLDLKFLSTRAA